MTTEGVVLYSLRMASPQTQALAPLAIGPHRIWPPLILAPMSGVTNRTMRALYRPFGLGLTVTEFVSANALQFGSRRTMEMIDLDLGTDVRRHEPNDAGTVPPVRLGTNGHRVRVGKCVAIR